MRKRIFWWIVGVFILIYGFGAGSSQLPFGDSSELIAAGLSFGMPHPPGYGLSNVLVWLITQLDWLFNVLWLSHVLSVVFHAFTLGFVYLVNLELIRLAIIKPKSNMLAHLSALSGVLTLGFSRSFWLYSQVYEVFPMNNLFGAMFVWLVLRILNAEKKQLSPLLYWLAGVSGLMAAHHQLSWLVLLPGLIVVGWRLWKLNLWREMMVIRSVILMVVGFVGSVLLLLLFHVDGWYLDRSLSGLVGFFLRQDFSGVTVAGGDTIDAYFKFGNVADHLRTLWFYLRSTQVDNPGVLISLIGLWLWMKSRGQWMVKYFLLSVTILSTVFVGAYLIVPLYSESAYFYQIIGMTQRMYLMGYVILSMSFGQGMMWLYQRFMGNRQGMWMSLLFVFALANLVSNLGRVSLRGYTAFDDYAQQLLSSKADSVLVCFSDYSCFGLMNAQARGIGNDVVVIPATWQFQTLVRRDHPELFLLEYEDKQIELAMMVAKGVADGKDIYLIEEPDLFVKRFGMDGSVFDLVPVEYAHKVVSSTEGYEYEPQRVTASRSDIDYLKSFVLYLKETHLKNAELLSGYGMKTEALSEVDAALSLFENDMSLRRLRYQLDNTDLPIPELKKKSVDEFLILGAGCDENHDYGCAFDYYLKAVLKDPSNIDSHRSLFTLFEKLNLDEMADSEQLNMLLLKSSDTY